MSNSIAKAYVQIVPTTTGIQQNLTNELAGAGDSAGQASGSKFASAFKKVASVAAIGAAFKAIISEGADLEQSLGGIETLFGDSADTVIANAKAAYETAGMSANEYMENVTSFSASLLNSLAGDTEKAASVADMAMVDMSDNANKMGTDMESIQNAYQGFAKQNYTMLDNLKLGYGGTKTEMERLLADAQEISGVEYDIDNLSDVYEAIHVIQGELGITGTTAAEASTTITGSFTSMKAAFENVLGSLALGEDITPSLNALVETTVAFIKDNLIPMLSTALLAIIDNLPDLIMGIIDMLDELLPVLMDAILVLVERLVSNLPEIYKMLITALLKVWQTIIAKFKEWGGQLLDVGKQMMQGLINGIKSKIADIIGAITGVCSKIIDKIKSLLGIHSPSTVFYGFGENITAGLVNGIDDGQEDVNKAMRSLANTAEGSFSTSVEFGGQSSDVISAIAQLGAEIKNIKLYLDGDTLVGGTVTRMNKAIKSENLMIARGVV